MACLLSGRASAAAGAVGSGLILCALAFGQPPMNDAPPMSPGPVYQRHAMDGHMSDDGHMFDGNRRDNWRMNRDGRRDSRRDSGFEMSPRISSGWFERPYPDHLDFFRMRFGSRVGPLEAPYGPTLPAYYGPYYTGAGLPNAPYGEAENNGPLVAVPDEQGAAAAGSMRSGANNGDALPAPTRVDGSKSQN